MKPVDRALWYIESHFRDDISLDDIARNGGVSRFHLSRAFAAATTHSVIGYLRGRRLTEAARQLAGRGLREMAAHAPATGVYRAARKKLASLPRSLIPGSRSTPEATSTASGRTIRIASVTLSGFSPPARMVGIGEW